MTKTVTFWSYKGGAGRTIALVNTAFQLARLGKKVVIWEMDLEAPGLLQIPLFAGLAGAVTGGVADILRDVDDDRISIEAGVRKYTAAYQDDRHPGIGFHVLAAGVPDRRYHGMYVALKWSRFFGVDVHPFGYDVFAEIQHQIKQAFNPDFILIDARTGLTDLGAVCTFYLPDTVVLAATLAHQGLTGLAEVNRTIAHQNKRIRQPGRAVDTLVLISHIPSSAADIVQERLDAFAAEGLKPAVQIRLQEDLLVRETIVSRDAPGHVNYAEFQKLARLLSDPHLDYVKESTQWIDMRGIGGPEGLALRLDISRAYMRLATRSASGARGEPIPVEKALDSRCSFLSAEPGGGKTTFLRWLAQRMVRRQGEPTGYPVLIRLAELDAHISRLTERNEPGSPPTVDSPEWIRHFLRAQPVPVPDEPLESGEAVFLLDGLDEAYGAVRRESLTRLIERAAMVFPQARFVLTSRPGYPPPAGFQPFQIDELDKAALSAHLDLWCDLLFPGDKDAAARHAIDLRDAVESNPAIDSLARNPLMLTAIVVAHWNDRRLPEQRAELFESIVSWLIRSRQDSGPSPNGALDSLGRLALHMQDRDGACVTDVDRAEAAEVLSGGRAPSEALAEMDTITVSSGMLVSRGSDVRFWHAMFREYLAARQLAGLPDAEIRSRIERGGWPMRGDMRETLLLLAGVLARQGRRRLDALFASLLPESGAPLEDKAHRVALLAAMLRDVRPYGGWIQPPGYREAVLEMTALFEAGAAPELAFATRMEAAEALATVGDPRLRTPSGADYWISIPAGTALSGAQPDPAYPGYDPDAHGERTAVASVDAFEIGRYPVTVQEYARFVESGGTPPGEWEQQRVHPSRPVVRVSRAEAEAYCAFAQCRLPSELEWEFAARGAEGRRFPWGEDPPTLRHANFAGGSPTPVGLFPAGATPDGIHDMAGNVAEWTFGASVRGGSWCDSETLLRSARRSAADPTHRHDSVGFRCARSGATVLGESSALSPVGSPGAPPALPAGYTGI